MNDLTDLTFYYLVDSSDSFDSELNENSVTIDLRPSSSSNQKIIELKHPYLTAPKTLSIGKLKKHIFRKLTRKMAKLAKIILKNGNSESLELGDCSLQSKKHLIDALSLLDNPTQIRIFIGTNDSTESVQLKDEQIIENIHSELHLSEDQDLCLYYWIEGMEAYF